MSKEEWNTMEEERSLSWNIAALQIFLPQKNDGIEKNFLGRIKLEEY